MSSLDNVLNYKNFEVLKIRFEEENLRLTIRLLCVFGCGGEEAIYATHDDNVFGFGRNRFGGLGLGTLDEHIHSPRFNRTLSGIQVSNIFCGFEHWIALTDNGRCYAWGHNQFGQLGIGSLEETATPQMIDLLADKYVIDISCGGFFTLALTVEREVYGWGHNQFGQLADGSFIDRSVPVRTKIDCEVHTISCGIKHAMGVSHTGKLYVWGLNSYGQLGRPPVGQQYIKKPEEIPDFETTKITKAVCGSNHSLVMTANGLVYAFGENSGGQIGNGQTEHQYMPFNVEPDVRFKDIIGHKENDISIAVSLDDKYYIWGLAKNRRILRPKVIVSSESVFDIYAKFTKKCVTFKTVVIDESLKDWEKIDRNRNDCDPNQSSDGLESVNSLDEEDNKWIQIGRKNSRHRKTSISSTNSRNDRNDSKSIRDVIDLNHFQAIGLPSIVSQSVNDIRLLCVLGRGNSVIFATKDDYVYGFGHNRNGYLGLGHWKEDIKRPEMNQSLSHQQIVDIVWGFEHCVGLTSSGQCLSWGQNRYGQLGIGSYNPSNTPQLIKEFCDKTVVQLCSGSYHSMALTSDGEVFSWGHNTFAQLGDRTYNSRESPTQILIKEKVTAIACGHNHAVALTTAGSVYVWGVNECGQLARPRERDVRSNRDKPMCNRPQKVPYFDNIAFKQVVCGSNHTLLLTTDGCVFAFGDNSNGQIGNGTADTQQIPFKITSLPKIKEIVSNRENDLSIAVTEDNNFFAWGLLHNKTSHVELKPKLIPTNPKTTVFDVYMRLAKNKVTFKAVDVNFHIENSSDSSVTQSPLKTANEFKIDIESKISQIIERFDSNSIQVIEEDKNNEVYDDAEDANACLERQIETSFLGSESIESNQNAEWVSGSGDLSFGSDGHVIRSSTWKEDSLASVDSETTPADVFLSRLRQSFNNPDNFDLKVISGDNVFYCHKTVLKIRNEMFWELLSQKLNDENIWSTYSQLEINPTTGPAFYAFLQFMYAIEPTISAQFVEDLIKMAQHFNEPELEDLCTGLIQNSHQELEEENLCHENECQQLIETIDEINVYALYEKAVKEGSLDLENSCVEFAANNWKNICRSDEFQAMDDILSKRLLSAVINSLQSDD